MAFSGVTSSASGVLWLAAPDGVELGLRRHSLRPGAELTRLRIPAGGEAICDVEARGTTVVRAEGLGGAVSLSAGLDFGDQALAENTALLMLDDQTQGLEATAEGYLLRLRSGDRGELDVDVGVEAREGEERAALTWGRYEEAIGEAGITRLELPPGPKYLRLTLSRGLAAGLEDGRSFWAELEGYEGRIETDSKWLRVVDVAGAGGRVAIDSREAALGPTLRSGASFERRLAGRGSIETLVGPHQGAVDLHVLGAEATLLQADGLILRTPSGGAGSVARNGVGSLGMTRERGRLILDYGRGQGGARQGRAGTGDLVMAWLESADSPAFIGRGLGASSTAATRLEMPSSVVLDGTAGESAFEVDLESEAVLSVRLASPALSIVDGSGGERHLSVHPAALDLEVALEPGVNRLELRGLAGEPLRGTADFRLSPIERLGEGLGGQILLAPGESRYFAVDVTERGQVGFGVDAEADVLEARLLDAAGEQIGSGVAQMHDLEAGRYLFVLSLPRGQAPIRAQPAVVGLERPGTGPPREVLEGYLRWAASP